MRFRSRSKIDERKRKENLEIVARPRSGSQHLVGRKINKKKKKEKEREDLSIWKVGKWEENLKKNQQEKENKRKGERISEIRRWENEKERNRRKGKRSSGGWLC